jgi:hypothetical protein
MSDSKTIHRVVMGKKVARQYLEEVTDEGYTITVYASAGEPIDQFLHDIRSRYSGKISSITEEFDHVTILSMSESVMEKVVELAKSKGLQTTGFNHE